jgi:hypothetical protein
VQITKQLRDQSVTFLVPDNQTVTEREKMLLKAESWLMASQMALTDAVARATSALVYTNQMSATHKRMLQLYFNVPQQTNNAPTPDAVYRAALNRIVAVLNTTSIGLNANTLTIADTSQMPGIAKVHAACMLMSASSFAGLVYESPVEWASRLIGKAKMPPTVAPDPRQGYICLNFNGLYEKGDWYAIVTLIHEATHKFARTEDIIYFDPKEGMTLAEHLETQLDAGLRMYRDVGVDTTAQEVEMVKNSTLAAHAEKKGKIATNGLMSNADSFANYAFDAPRLLS